MNLVRKRSTREGSPGSPRTVLLAEASRVKDAFGACERSDVLDAAAGRGARLEGAQNNTVVLGRPQQAPSPLHQHNQKLALDKEHHI